jgi:L-threonylcarbamoyladenylate synthase
MNFWQLDLAVKTLKAGGIIAYPTESVFGLGCDASNLKAIARLLAIKQRSYKKGLIVLVSDIQQALPLLSPLSSAQIAFMNQPSIRATTWLIDKRPGLSPLLVGEHDKLAVRVTDNPIAKNLCDLFAKPIVSTSCNLNAKPTSSRVSNIRNKMRLKVDQIVGGACCGQPASQIIDLQSGNIIRQ